jgi:hypothetical protein
MKASLRKIRRSEQGAAAAETAITIMTFLIVILGIIQVTLAINAKLLVNYAAYCAARAGIVHNGDQQRMEQAVAVALTPLLAESDSPSALGLGYAKAQLNLALGLLRIERLSPNSKRFQRDYDKRFFPEYTQYGGAPKGNDLAKLDENLLTVRVTYYFPLEVPLINQILRPIFHRVKISSTHRMRMQSDKRFQ